MMAHYTAQDTQEQPAQEVRRTAQHAAFLSNCSGVHGQQMLEAYQM